MLQRQHGLDQPGDTGGRIEMSEIGLQRTQATKPRIAGGRAKCAGQRSDFDRIAQWCRGPVRLDVTDASRMHSGQALGSDDCLQLTIDARRGIAGLG